MTRMSNLCANARLAAVSLGIALVVTVNSGLCEAADTFSSAVKASELGSLPEGTTGFSVAVAGDLAVVGAQWHKGFRGAAYLFMLDGGKWMIKQELSPADPGRHDHFGGAVAIDGERILVAAPWHDSFGGAVYVFEREDGKWIERRKLVSSESQSALRLLPVESTRVESGLLEAISAQSSSLGEADLPMAAVALEAPSWIEATDDVYEDRVLITWENTGQDAIIYKILRDGVLLTVASSDELSYSDYGGALGDTCQYCVVVEDMYEVETEPVCDDGGRAIKPPVSVSASDGLFTDKVQVTWLDISAINTGYSIYRNGSPIGTASPNAGLFVDTNADPLVAYLYEVTATVTGGFQSVAGSDSGWRGVILPPSDVSASDGQYLDRVLVTWHDQAEGELGYRIYRDDTLIDSTLADAEAYEDTTVMFNEAYGYCVATVAAAYTESARMCDAGRTGLTPPGNVSASDSSFDDRIQITWEDLSTLEDGYEISRSVVGTRTIVGGYAKPERIPRQVDAADNDPVVLAVLATGAELYNDFSAQPGVAYIYFVRALSDEGGASLQVSDTGSRSPVLAPYNVVASDGAFEDRTLVSWESSSTTAVLFKIYRDGGLIKTVGSTTRSYNDRGGTAGREYDYAVSAVTALKIESAGIADHGGRELKRPTYVAATDDQFERKTGISWTDNSYIEVGYHVYRAPVGGTDSVLIATTDANRTSHIDATGQSGVTYRYSVAAFDTVGGMTADSPVGYDNGSRLINPPTNVQASDGFYETRVDISWVDNSNAEDGYYVFRDSVLIGTTGDNTTSFVDETPLLGAPRLYSIAAYDGYGASAHLSDEGEAVIFAPVSFNASVQYSFGIELSWVDVSEIEQGYKIFRDGGLLATLEQPNVSSFHDECVKRGVLEGGLNTPGSSMNMAVWSQYSPYDRTFIVVADGYSGAQVVQKNEWPPYLMLIGNCDTPGFAWDIVKRDHYFYVADGESGLSWMDAHEEGYPSYDGTFDLPGISRAIGTSGSYVFIAGDGLELHVFNVSQPNNPQLVATFPSMSHEAWDIAVSGSLAYIADGSFGVHVCDIADPANPVMIGHYDTPGVAYGVYALGGYLCVAAGTAGLVVLDVSVPETPSFVTSYDTPGSAKSVVVDGDIAYLADDDNGMIVLGLWDLPEIATLSTRQSAGPANAVVMDTDHVIVAEGDAGLQLFRKEKLGSGGSHTYCVRAFSGSTQSKENVCALGSQPFSPVEQLNMKLLPGDGVFRGLFGHSVATDGAYALVGSRWDNDYGMASGSAYVFMRGSDGIWDKRQKLHPGDAAEGDEFGFSVDVSNTVAIVGARYNSPAYFHAGAAYIFRLSGGVWSQEAKLVGSDSHINSYFGYQVAIDGDWAIVYAENDGSSYFFHHVGGGSWSETQKINGQGGVAISGDYAITGGNNSAFIYEFDGGTWNQVQTLTPHPEDTDAQFGASVSISGGNAIVGAPSALQFSGVAYLYERGLDGTWREIQRIVASDGNVHYQYGTSVSIEGNTSIVGASNAEANGVAYAGAAYVLRRRGGRWLESQKIVADASSYNDYFGLSVDISRDALIVGMEKDDDEAEDSGSAYMLNFVQPLGAGVVSASDGVFDERVSITWVDAYSDEAGFHIYRNGDWIDDVGPDAETYNDAGAQPGRTYQYGVSAFFADDSKIDLGQDFGRRPVNGVIGGRVSSLGGDGIGDIEIHLDPPVERALLCDGLSGQVIVEEDSIFSFSATDSFTVEMWIKYAASADSNTTNENLIAKCRLSEAYPFLLRTDHGNGRPGGLVFSISDGMQVVEVPSSRNDLNDNRWHHISCVHDPHRQESRLYIDGSLDSLVTYSGLGDISNSEDLYFGYGNTGNFGGIIDEIRIWRTAKTGEEIQSSMYKHPAGDEYGLLGYWPFNEGSGIVATDFAGAAQYGILEIGTYWTDNAAPIVSHVATDAEGNYVLDDIYYGEQATFSVRPSGGQREFQPGYKTVTLSTGHPVENLVDFIDITMYAITGSIAYAGTGCPVADADLLVDGEVKGRTDKNGKYSFSVDGGERTFEVSLAGHSFDPQSVTLDVREHMAIGYSDTTKHTVRGRVGGGCDRYIGEVSIFLRSESGCLTDTIVTDSTFSVSLPPMVYYVSGAVNPDSIPPGLVVSDVIDFFNDLGEREVGLTTATDTTLDFIYRAPLQVAIRGFEPYITCDQLTLEDETPLPDSLPVVPQMTEVLLTVEVNEDYGNGSLCPLDTGLVLIYDELMEMGNRAQEIPVSNGIAKYTAFAAVPSFVVGRQDAEMNNRSYQKAITAVAMVEGKDPVPATEWVLVTGHLAPEGSEFVTFTADEMPLYILRDPAGDKSYAYLEDGYTSCATIDFDIASAALGLDIDHQFRWGFDKTFFIGFGGGVILNVKGEAVLKDKWKFDWKVDRNQRTEICLSTKERFSTSASDQFIGEPGDVFIGAGLNFLFAKVNTIEIENCVVVRSTDIGVQPEGFETAFSYTDQHIRDVLIPELLGISEYYGSIGEADSAAMFLGKANNWQHWLDENRRLKSEAITTVNRSFSAGADFEFSHQADTISSFTRTTTFRLEHKFMTGAAFDIFGASKLEFLVGYHHVNERVFGLIDTTGTATQVIGYVLSDDDMGDNFTVDIKNDGYFPSPVFDVLGGVSSCPWEPWRDPPDTGEASMVARDGAVLLIDKPVVSGVQPDGAAVFKLTLSNASDETREYHLRGLSASNPDGAVIKVNGGTITSGLSYLLEPNEAQEVTMTVERGPERYTYDDLRVFLYPPCEYAHWENGGLLQRADTVSFSVGFVPPCSEITMMQPEASWSMNIADQASGDSLLFILRGYEIDIGEADEGFTVQHVGAQYRYLGSGEETAGPWYDIAADSLGSVETLIRWLPPDTLMSGTYELRAFAHCEYGRGYSGSVAGVIDFDAPFVFGPPQPADEDLSFGEYISATFNENLDCRSIRSDSIVLMYVDGPFAGDTIASSASCDGRTIIISAIAPSNTIEGLRIEASIRGVRDCAGNPMAQPVAWCFVWNRSRFVWSSRTLSASMVRGNIETMSARLVNGSDGQVDYTITGMPQWITGASSASGLIARGGSKDIEFSLRQDLAIGSYEGVVVAEAVDTSQGVALLDVDLTVACGEPSWVVDPGAFEFNMPIVAVLDIGGVTSTDTVDAVAAFVGNELRGWANVVHLPLNPDPYLVFLTTYSNRPAGETLRFEVWDSDSCKLYNWTEESYPFDASAALGSPTAPIRLTASEILADTVLAIDVDRGWNWISTNVTSANMGVNSVLSSIDASPGDLIKSSTQFSQFVDSLSGWTGSLSSLDNVSGYLVNLTEPGMILHTGTPASEAVPVQRGWNWIGYVPRGPLDVLPALDDLSVQNILQDDDIVKSQAAFAIYNGGSWYGSLATMAPGRGYKIYLSAASETPGVDSFVYPVYVYSPPPFLASGGDGGDPVGGDPVGGDVQATAGEADAASKSAPRWRVDSHAYQFNMTVTAVIRIGGMESIDGNDMIGAFVGDECRGVARPVYVAGIGRYLAFMMIYTNEPGGEAVEMRAFDADEDLVYDIVEPIACRCDAVMGSAHAPVILNTGSVHDEETPALPSAFALEQNYPNPFNPSTEIRYDVPKDGSKVSIRIFDVAGRLVRTLVDRVEDAGRKSVLWDGKDNGGGRVTTGVYFYRMDAPGFAKTRKLVLLR